MLQVNEQTLASAFLVNLFRIILAFYCPNLIFVIYFNIKISLTLVLNNIL